ncbi:uncharacterized protein [Diadema setosum]|uniref:uncharacterized protein n=1 Tax=Diadema setosum TaxID=31175 RepID=UPI003B3B140E
MAEPNVETQSNVETTRGSPSSDSGASSSPAVNAAGTIKLPPFWRADPQVWFAQAEAQFTTKGITREETKYSHVIATLTPDVAMEVRDIIINTPKNTPYTVLKRQLTERMSESEQRRVQKLLTEEELGDRKPSQLLRRMNQLVGEQQLEKGIMRQLFLQRLPNSVRLILASTKETLPLTELAELADRILDAHIPTVNMVDPPVVASAAVAPSTAQLDELVSLLQGIETRLKRLEIGAKAAENRSRSRSRSRGRARKKEEANAGNAPAETEQQPADLCWYHHKYGDKAERCKAGCKHFPAGN